MNAMQTITAFNGLFRKETMRYLRIWPQSLIPAAIVTTLYFLIFGHVIGHRIGNMQGVSYITFIAPGLILSAVITNSYTNSVTTFYLSRFTRTVEELLVSPMPNWLIISSYATAGMTRGILTGIIVAVISLFFTQPPISHPFLLLATLLLCSLFFSLAGFLNAIFARKFDDTIIATTFFLTPLIYLGGVFYSINQLPPFWRALSSVNPIYYLINLFRYGLLGISDAPIDTSFAILIALIIVTFSACLYCMNKGIRIKV
jgi:ABC-2 type transport system permease protein